MLIWHQTRNGLTVTGLGCQDLLALPMMGFFASRQCPGSAIRAAMDWALQQARSKNAVISGFHSPLEQSVLAVLIEARSPVVAVLARPVECARLPPEWIEPLTQGLMAVVSVTTAVMRLTGAVATARNNFVAQLVSQIVVSHTSPGGALEGQCLQWRGQGRQVILLPSEVLPNCC